MRRPWKSRVVDLPAWAAFLFCFGTLLETHLFFFRPPMLLHGLDEGYVNAFAWRMIDGQMLPFVDAVSHRGPLMYWVVALAVKLGSPLSWLPIRVVSMLCGLITLTFTFLAGWRSGRALTGAIAALAVVIAFVLGMGPSDGHAYSGEHLSNVFVTGALLCLTAALDRDRAAPSVWLVGLTGALAAMGGLAKQVGIVSVVPLGLWVVAAAVGRPGLARRARVGLCLAFGAGVVLPVAITVARYAAAGEVATLVYYTFTYNSQVYLGPYPTQAKIDTLRAWAADHGVLLGILAPMGMWAVTRPLAAAPRLRYLPRAWDEHGFVATVGAGALLSVATANAPMRDWAHYYIPVVPWCGLLLGLLVELCLTSRSRIGALRDGVVRALVLLVMTGGLYIGTRQRFDRYAIDRRLHHAFSDDYTATVCAWVKARSGPRDALFVWGFYPQLYTSCARRPASRYVFTTFVAGFVPWFAQATRAEDEARAAPRSRELLVADLERSRPRIILDNGASIGNRMMHDYPVLAAYLAQHYCKAGVPAGIDAYLRRSDEGRCPPDGR
jgi:4-amino-4-deoxy-L-arabinose transferase-like glycosyltransferase